jgi:hypothetical protein
VDEEKTRKSLEDTINEAKKQKRRATLYDRVESTMTVAGQTFAPLKLVG